MISDFKDGVIYTPIWIVKLILKNLDFDINKTILDPACGDGAFLCEVLRIFIEKEKNKIKLKELLEKNIFGFDIDNNALNLCENNLNNILKENKINLKINWNLFNFDSLDKSNIKKYYNYFDFIVGNPPYIRIQHLGKTKKERIQKEWSLSIKGATDIYIPFFEMSYQLLNKNGKIGFITPNTYLKTQAGKDLRFFLKEKKVIEKIINFNHHQLFNKATTYSLITIINKKHNSNIFQLFEGNNKQEITFIDNINSNNLNINNWILKDNKTIERIKEIESKKTKLKDIAKIYVGLQTSADNFYIFKNPKFLDDNIAEITLKDKRVFKIEKNILKPIVKVSVLKNKYENQNRFIIFPYEPVENKNKIIDENKLKNKFPLTYNYFLSIKDDLLKIKRQSKDNCFYSFGRIQGLDKTFGNKILTSFINKKPNFILNKNKDMTFYAGYCIKYNGDLERLTKILNSDDMDFYIKNTSRDYQNGYKAYSKKFIENFCFDL